MEVVKLGKNNTNVHKGVKAPVGKLRATAERVALDYKRKEVERLQY